MLFSQAIKHKLATRGGTLTRNDCQNHRSTDQGLHEKLLVEYTIQGNYDEHAFPDVVDNMDASIFEPIPSRFWQKSNKKLKAMTKEYESKILACKKLGFNGTFEDMDEKKLGRTTPMMQYMHQYFKSNPALKDVAISLLPPGTFCQSSSGPPPAPNTPVEGAETAAAKRVVGC